MNRTTPICIALGVTGALAFVAVGGVSCSENGTSGVDFTYEDPYLYDYYYPADIAYSSMYWANAWNYSDLYFATLTSDGGTTGVDAAATGGGGGGTGGSSGTSTGVRGAVGAAIRALARGEPVCPGQTTINLKSENSPCVNPDRGPIINDGATIVFNGCQLPGGGSVSGTVDITGHQTASDQVCSATTTITLSHTTQITNLVYTGPNGGKLVIPTQTDTGTNTFTFNTNPATVTIMSMG
jgi:hypothetical protein